MMASVCLIWLLSEKPMPVHLFFLSVFLLEMVKFILSVFSLYSHLTNQRTILVSVSQ